MRIVELTKLEEKRRYLHFLLEADPSEEMIQRYLSRGRMFLLEQPCNPKEEEIPEEAAPKAQPLGEVVIVDLGEGRCEIKNLFVVAKARRLGYGRLLVEQAAYAYRETCTELLVGTSESGVPFYERCGFHYAYTVPGFFTINYTEPIMEDGKRCKDMIYLRRTADASFIPIPLQKYPPLFAAGLI